MIEFLNHPDQNFPDVEKLPLNQEIIALGGDLSKERLVSAYTQGIFPWYNDNDPCIVWWSTNPRFIIEIKDFKIPKSLQKFIKKNNYTTKINYNFVEIINNCQNINRDNQNGTWITDYMKDAYINLQRHKIAWSVGTYANNELIGGLYGIKIGKMFAGESMFHYYDNASKIALVSLYEVLKKEGVLFIDCQQESNLLKLFGGKLVNREYFFKILKKATL